MGANLAKAEQAEKWNRRSKQPIPNSIQTRDAGGFILVSNGESSKNQNADIIRHLGLTVGFVSTTDAQKAETNYLLNK